MLHPLAYGTWSHIALTTLNLLSLLAAGSEIPDGAHTYGARSAAPASLSALSASLQLEPRSLTPMSIGRL